MPRSTPQATRAPRAGGLRRVRTVLVLVLLVGVGLLGYGLWPRPAPEAPLPERTFDLRSAPTPALPPLPPLPSPSVPAPGPDRLVIPSLGVDAPLVPERVRADGELVIPGDPGTVGVWAGGPALTAPAGTSVLAGHVSVRGLGDGALVALHRVEPGALVVTTAPDGSVQRWRVDALEVRHKDDLPPLPTTGPRRLVVVTCGGPVFHTPQGDTFRDNVLAYASPLA